MIKAILIMVLIAGLVFAGCNQDSVVINNDTNNTTNITTDDFEILVENDSAEGESSLDGIVFVYFIDGDGYDKATGPWSKEYM